MIAVDTSTQAIKLSNAVTSLVSNAFSPPAGSLLVAVVAGTGNANAATGVTDSLGGHLTWSLLKAQTTNGCDAEVWTAPCLSAQAGMTVTVTFAGSQDITLGVLVLNGANATQSGNSVSGTTSASGTPSGSITSTAAGSYVLSVVADATNQTVPNGVNINTITFNGQTYRTLAASTRSVWVQGAGNAGDSGSTITIADTTPTAIAYSMVTVEILSSGQVWGGAESGTQPKGQTTIPNPSQLSGMTLALPARATPLLVGQGVLTGSTR